MYSADPVLKWCTKSSVWILQEAFTVTWGGQTWEIPKGFRTDLASIPRLFQGLIPKVGKHIQPAIAHDFFYVHGGITKKQADDMFLDGMKYSGVSWWKRRLMYRAVRVGGNGIWG